MILGLELLLSGSTDFLFMFFFCIEWLSAKDEVVFLIMFLLKKDKWQKCIIRFDIGLHKDAEEELDEVKEVWSFVINDRPP